MSPHKEYIATVKILCWRQRIMYMVYNK